MSINMADVTKITWPRKVIVYKQTLEFTNSAVVYRNDSSTPCPIKVTLYSTITPTFTATDTSSIAIYNYLSNILGYTPINNRFYLTVDNPYEFYYNDGTYDCVLASCQVRNSATVGSYFVPWFSVPGATSAQAGSAYTITVGEWQEVGEVYYDFYTKYFLRSTLGVYTYLGISKDIVTGEEYISNYCIDGVSYPDVTIVSVRDDNYTLSNGHSYAVTTQNMKSFVQLLEVKKIENLNGDVLWKSYEPTWHTIWSGSKQSIAEAYYSSWRQYKAGGVITTINTNDYDTPSNVQVRVTFSMSAGGEGGTSFTPSNKKSPVTFTGIGRTNSKFLKAEAKASNAAYYVTAYCSYTVNGSTGTFQLYVGRNGTSIASNQAYSAQVTVTKIELYY